MPKREPARSLELLLTTWYNQLKIKGFKNNE
jgi:hypothetical protein